VPTQRLYRPLLTRLYFKLGVLHEMQGLVDRSVLCYQEVLWHELVLHVCTVVVLWGWSGFEKGRVYWSSWHRPR